MTVEIYLRDVLSSDLPIFYEHQDDQVANRLAVFPAREWDAFQSHWTRIMADNAIVKQAIIYNGQVAGNMVCFEQSGKREIGYWLGRTYWGKGIATRALAEFLSLVKYRPLYAHVAEHNLGSIRVLDKCGFILVGEDKEFAVVDGVLVKGKILMLK
jgi:RimJ/RimL family protein N-acetyltransferase